MIFFLFYITHLLCQFDHHHKIIWEQLDNRSQQKKFMNNE